ncbi:hypothetical protein SeMB42_g04139 [Synchytrium endobioticum]|uniref:Ubiquinol-cytochrome C reductase hinge domain-containing protein n=1 Tax=Synchytrium endobioticum TaxID=286115 RepID=A0A507D0N3_9FUNG|nr:hypothetical protein SeMB42_g04139 [Synchytrium endobioticum]
MAALVGAWSKCPGGILEVSQNGANVVVLPESMRLATRRYASNCVGCCHLSPLFLPFSGALVPIRDTRKYTKMSSEDPKPGIEKECEEHHCPSLKGKFESCQARVSETEGTEESCVEEFFDLMECVQHCAAPKVFAILK